MCPLSIHLFDLISPTIFYSSFVHSRGCARERRKRQKTSFLRLFDYDQKQISCFWLTEEFLAWNRAARRKATALIGSEIHCILKSFLHYLSLMTQIQFRPTTCNILYYSTICFSCFSWKSFSVLYQLRSGVFTLRSPSWQCSKSEIWVAET